MGDRLRMGLGRLDLGLGLGQLSLASLRGR